MYYECHITLTPEHEDKATPIAEKHGFKTSKIAGDEVLGDKVFFYCTSHGKDFNTLRERMGLLTECLLLEHIPILRRKIEYVVFDERFKNGERV